MSMILIFLHHLVIFTSAFLFDDRCFATPPCFCQAAAIVCENMDLHSVPSFQHTNYDWSSTLDVKLSGNCISTVENSSFTTLGSTNVSALMIDLSDNQIYAVSPGAFLEVEDIVRAIDFENNNLTVLPEALGTLSHLETLKLRGNPLQSLASSVTFYLSRSVSALSVSLNLFTSWPIELHYFRLLSKLDIDGYQQPRLPLNALASLETTLTVFEISHSKLDRIPSVVCHLKHLRHLSYVSNPDTLTPLFEPCSRTISSLEFLGVQDNNLRWFPALLETFVNLDFLDVSQNKIRTIDESLVPADNVVTHLNLSFNNFNRVPGAVNRFLNLTSLFLAGNQITSLENHDLFNLTHLRVLQLADNPLEHISFNAFSAIRSFSTLDLKGTKLNTIPSAVTTLTGMNLFDIERTPIECTCKMDYLKSWSTDARTVHGTCEGTGEKLSSFLTDFLPYCP